MCVQSLIALWCPCKEHIFDRSNPGPETWSAFREHAKGHIITRLVFTGAYIWCDDYVRSPDLAASFHANPPNCPNGNLETEYEHYRSRTLCADCLGQGCSVPTEGSSAYYAGPHEVIAERMADMSTRLSNLENGIITVDAERPKPSQKPKKDKSKSKNKSKLEAKKDMAAPLRVIDLREDDAADIALLKAQRTAEKGKMKPTDNIEDQTNFRQPGIIAKEFLTCPIDMNPTGRKVLADRISKKSKVTPVIFSSEELAELDALPLLVLGKGRPDEGTDANN